MKSLVTALAGLLLAVAAPAEATPTKLEGDFSVTGNLTVGGSPSFTTPIGKSQVNNSVKRLELPIQVVIGAIANSTTYTATAPVNRAGTITAIKASIGTAIVGGTNTLTISKNGSQTLLSTANISPTTIAANTATALTLTSNAADLTFAAGDIIKVVHVAGTQGTPGAGETITVEFEQDDY